MPRKPKKIQRTESPVIIITLAIDGRIKIVATRNFRLPTGKLSELTGLGYGVSQSNDKRAVFLKPLSGLSWMDCREQVITILKSREAIQALAEDGFVLPLVIHDEIAGTFQVFTLTRQPRRSRRANRTETRRRRYDRITGRISRASAA